MRCLTELRQLASKASPDRSVVSRTSITRDLLYRIAATMPCRAVVAGTISMTIVSFGDGATMCSSSRPRLASSAGATSDSCSTRNCRFFDLLAHQLLLRARDPAAVEDDLVVLPRREEQRGDDEDGEPDGAAEIALLREIDLAHDGVVPDVLLDGVFDVDAHAAFSATRSRALRARGLRSTSASAGPRGLRVTSATLASAASRRKVCLTTRSSSE